jgi:hypothetical protein
MQNIQVIGGYDPIVVSDIKLDFFMVLLSNPGGIGG